MARRRAKKRTHAGANNPPSSAAMTGHANNRDPKSMVIRVGAGEVGSSVSQLASDVRQVMEPGTASRLKERRANKLRDYVSMCGPLGVTHMMLFSRSATGNTNLRLALAPRGPTLHFRIDSYSLSKDVRKAQRRPTGGGKEFTTPPLLVMNNFASQGAQSSSKIPRHLETLTTSVFQSLLPPINPQATPLKSIRRVLLLNRDISDSDDATFVVNFRHYAVTTRVTGISKPLKRLNAAEKLLGAKTSRKGGLPNLSKLQDIAEYMIGGEGGDGYITDGTSGSDAETDAEVEVFESVPRKLLATKPRAPTASLSADDGNEMTKALDVEDNVERRAVKLVELGPRMRLRMTKVEEGMCGGKILWHEHVHKSKDEIKELEQRWEQRQQEKEARKTLQKENVAKKRRAKEAAKMSDVALDENHDSVDVDDHHIIDAGAAEDSEDLIE